MKVWKCLLTGDEVCTDAFKVQPVIDKEGNPVEGLLFTESKNVTKSDGEIDIGCGNSFGGGGEEDAVASEVQTVNNFIDAFQLTETQIGTANDLKAWLKDYMMAVVAKLKEKISDVEKRKEKIQAFKAQGAGIAKFLITNHAELQFYLLASFDPESMVFAMYPEGALAPNFYFIEAATSEEKF